MPDFLPATDAGVQEWANPFSAKLTANAAQYGCSTSQASVLATDLSTYSSKLALCKDPATRGPTAVQQKSEAKIALVTEIRALARQIQGYQPLTNDQRQQLGLTVRKARTKIPVPATSPHLDITSVSARTVSCKVHGDDSLKRAFPAGVKSVFIFAYVGNTPPSDPAAFTFMGTSSKVTFDVDFPLTVPGGARVWIAAAWANPSNQTGVACDPVSTFLQAGAAAAA